MLLQTNSGPASSCEWFLPLFFTSLLSSMAAHRRQFRLADLRAAVADLPLPLLPFLPAAGELREPLRPSSLSTSVSLSPLPRHPAVDRRRADSRESERPKSSPRSPLSADGRRPLPWFAGRSTLPSAVDLGRPVSHLCLAEQVHDEYHYLVAPTRAEQ
ncbi:hypothetical protein E2562_034632 [Oryza meyeriana var. granulata]|uniref:Uncharacterized protein n=1 Tax=Oryza meyeriana var. granulata TaxID=110450 RepID=A0A6G1F1J4_9ORYZ|nr:hypothetical protein E2562_034632 [Oryza meyeriana var. granulata]